jgi:tetratricopeptide (TPR) repeat protein
MHDNILSKEVRFWTKKQKFIYPVFERVDCSSVSETDIILCSRGRQDYQLALQEIEIWKNNNPMLATPYYYEGLILLALGQYEEFMIVAERFMYMNNKESMASTMNRYYYALVTLISKKKIKPVLQNINLCICHKPIMPEFWCLMGDAYYHLQGDFQLAMSFYENAIELGKYRLKTDKWPMDISKYKAYPEKMIDSCKKIIDNQGTFKIPNHL